MRRSSARPLFVLIIALAVVSSIARGEIPPLLSAAIQKWVIDENHWAFTQTVRRTDREEGETVEQFDPSKPDEQQWTLVQYRGKVPTEEQTKKWRERKEREMRNREKNPFGDLLDLDQAQVVRESAELITYEVPLRPIEGSRLPPENFRVLVDVNRKLTAIEHLDVSLRNPFRMKGVTRVNAVAISCELRVIDEKYAPQPARVVGSGSGRLFGMIKVGHSGEVRWSNYRRVKPFRNRFDVKLGDLKALDF